MIHPLDAMADAIMQFEGWKFTSRSWRNRNPGNLRWSKLQAGTDNAGYAIFNSTIEGYDALLYDLFIKFSGKSRTGLKPTDTLGRFFEVYAPAADRNDPGKYALFVAERVTWWTAGVITPSTTLREIWSPEQGPPFRKTGSQMG